MRKAFTLIELLVVVSIIAILIAILLPALSNARYMANVTKCQVAVRSIAAVQLSYAIDNKEFFPQGLARYSGSVHTYKVNASSINDTDTWVINNGGNHRNVMMPRDLAR